MLLNYLDNEKIFSKVVPISVKDMFTNESRLSYLLFTVEWQESSSSSSSGMHRSKILSITLTDNDDPFFLYKIELAEGDYPQLKEKEKLLVDFPFFPQHIIGLIEYCLQEDENIEHKYFLNFNVNNNLKNMSAEAELVFSERNRFQLVDHLHLKFFAASQPAIRQYLASTIRCLKENNRQLHNNQTCMERDFKDKLAKCQTALTTETQKNAEIVNQLKFELDEKDNKYQKELQEERNKYISRHEDEMNRLKKDFTEKECNFIKEAKQYQSRVNDLETLNKELREKNFKNEAIIGELKLKVLSLEDEKNSLKQHLQVSNHNCDHLKSEIKEKQSRIHQLEEKIDDLHQELKNKGHSNSKLKDQIESEIEQKKSVKNELDNVKYQLEMSERTRQELENEKVRLNEIVVGLQEKSKELTKEDKNKSHLITKYKKTIDEKERALLDIKQKVADMNIKLQTENAEVKHLTESNVALQIKIDELAKKNKDQDNVIKWLNRQLTENCIVPEYNVPSHLTTSPSALAQKQLAKISSETSAPLITGRNVATKSVRIDATSPVCKQSSSTSSQFHRTADTDSAYNTASLHCNQATPEVLAGNHNMNYDPSNFEIDQEALSDAFRDKGGILKHSTAKKPMRPVKSSTPKSSKKR